MAELTINADEIAAALRKHVGTFTPALAKDQVGRILEVGDGIAACSGLPDTAVNELLEFEGGTLGLALNLDEDSIGAVVLGQSDQVEEGHTAKNTGRILSVPGRRRASSAASSTRSASRSTARARSRAPSCAASRCRRRASSARKPVHEPLQTGIKAIDSMTPIGRGQRELIIGDRKTGKTTIAIDTILNQRARA